MLPRIRVEDTRGLDPVLRDALWNAQNQNSDLVRADLKQQIGSTPETFSAWIAKLTPEMKERIKTEGLPLLTALYLVYQHQTGQAPQQNVEEGVQ